MTTYRYERDGYYVESLAPLSEADIAARLARRQADVARRLAARQSPRNPAWDAGAVVERYSWDEGQVSSISVRDDR